MNQKVCVKDQPCDCENYHPPGGKPRQWVVCAANYYPVVDLLVCGARHYDGVMREVLNTIDYPHYKREGYQQGFIDQFGNFLTREEAWVIATANGQICRDVDTTPGKLYSEHLY